MESTADQLVVILGQTASGKSQLGLEIAQAYNGEIIAADSRTIYRGMDIGTAKPSAADQAVVMHYGLDLVTPDETFSAAAFKHYAENVVKDIWVQHKLPIIVGGSGLYIDGLVYDFSFQDTADPQLRSELEELDLDALAQRAEALGIEPDHVNFLNKRHLVRAIERGGKVGGRRPNLPPNILLIGLRIQKEVLDQRIAERVNTMFANGLIEEVQSLIKQYGVDAPGLLAPGYKAVIQHLNGDISLAEAKEIFIRNDRRLAKRQQTWFKRNPDIVWCDNTDEAKQKIGGFLSEFDTIHT